MEENERMMVIKLQGIESAVLETQSAISVVVAGTKDSTDCQNIQSDSVVSEPVQAMEKLVLYLKIITIEKKKTHIPVILVGKKSMPEDIA
ncbi:hypothetical protein AYI70_g212 [Smittium culicis]|uniref:Uncharacterized protein n=1 Tax=Smittium culicis TaxID=133412 RepID=A0A1R1YHW8_9FUNG|nr:hypothetical protein AYI70_g212 [Smittium culicis]